MKRSQLLIIAAGIAAIVWLVRGRDPRPAAPAPVDEAAARSVVLPQPPASVVDESPDEGDALVSAVADTPALADPDAFRARVERTLALYRAETVYPPWSRPVDGSLPHLIAWDRGTGVGQPFAADDDGEIEGHVVLDRSFAGPGDPLTARGDDTGWLTAETVAFAPAGAGWQATLVPSAIAALAAAPRDARLVVRLELGDFWKELPVRFRYAAQPAFVVVGRAGDRVQDGSLAIAYHVDVTHVAPTLVQAVLYDAAGETPIATYSDWFRPTAPGRQTLTLTFFGKVLRERGIAGPYRVRALHGLVHLRDADPAERWWGHPDEPTLTAAHPLDAFSSASFASPETIAAIGRYESLIAAGGL